MRPSSSVGLRTAATRLPDEAEDPSPANIHGPRPWAGQAEGVGIVDGCREEDDLGPSHEVLERHEADAVARRLLAAVRGVVAVVAHHEVMPGRNLERPGVVELAVRHG